MTFHSTFTPECPELSRSGRTLQLISERRSRVEYDTHPEQNIIRTICTKIHIWVHKINNLSNQQGF